MILDTDKVLLNRSRIKSYSKKYLLNRVMDRVRHRDGGCFWYGTDYYGTISIGGISYLAHRVVMFCYTDFDITDSKIYICHKCDNPACVNPEHLYIGNARTNNRDRIERNSESFACGDKIWSCKLTSCDVDEIKRLLRDGYGYKRLARKFGVNRTTIRAIKRGETWKNRE